MQQNNLCRAKVGLLFLRDCGGAAITQCDTCGRPLCKQHRVNSIMGKGTVCPECSLKEKEVKNPGQADEGESVNTQRARMRSNYYRDHSYTPFLLGGLAGYHLYNDSDYHIFDNDRVTMHHGNTQGTDDSTDDSFDSTES